MEANSILKSLDSLGDWEVAVIGQSMLERLLLNLIRRVLPNSSQAETRGAFEFRGMFGQYGRNIDFLYYLDVITEDVRDDLVCIGHIRNEFAHTIEKIEFTTKNTAEKIAKLKIKDPNTQDMNRLSGQSSWFYVERAYVPGEGFVDTIITDREGRAIINFKKPVNGSPERKSFIWSVISIYVILMASVSDTSLLK